jgi:hypothetical protein
MKEAGLDQGGGGHSSAMEEAGLGLSRERDEEEERERDRGNKDISCLFSLLLI